MSLGCATSGPQDDVECYTSTLTAPFELLELEFIMVPSGDIGAHPLPLTLNLVVHDWSGTAGEAPTASATHSIPIDVDTLVSGPNTFTLPTPAVIGQASFCVGLGISTTDPNDTLWAGKSDTESVANASFVRGLTCGLPDFVTNTSVGFPGNWCMRPTLGQPVP